MTRCSQNIRGGLWMERKVLFDFSHETFDKFLIADWEIFFEISFGERVCK